MNYLLIIDSVYVNYKQVIQFDYSELPDFDEDDVNEKDEHKPRIVEFLETVLEEGGKMLEDGQLEHAKELWLEKFEDCAEIKEKAQKMADMMPDRNEEKSLMWAVAFTDAKTITILDTMIRLQIELGVSQSQSAEIIAMFEK